MNQLSLLWVVVRLDWKNIYFLIVD